MSREYKFPTWTSQEEKDKVLEILKNNTFDSIKLCAKAGKGDESVGMFKILDSLCRSKFMIGFAEGLEYAKGADIQGNENLEALKGWNQRLDSAFTEKLDRRIKIAKG